MQEYQGVRWLQAESVAISPRLVGMCGQVCSPPHLLPTAMNGHLLLTGYVHTFLLLHCKLWLLLLYFVLT